jgi:cyclase
VPERIGHRTLIVGRLVPGSEEAIARVFAQSDATELPRLIGVRHRALFSLRDLYMHLLESDDDPSAAIARYREHPLFVDISQRLHPYVKPYDPETWRSPADAIARPFYAWHAPDR